MTIRLVIADVDGTPNRELTERELPNDVLMFALGGLSIAMGNASREVQRAVRRITASNADDGCAKAIGKYVLA